jgi:uncharacterized membrane protein YagU involved in acid resistance
MIKTIIKFDYYLAVWFSSSNERIVPGTSFLFLNQASFMVMTIYALLIALLPFKIKIEVITAILMGLIALVMYGFHKTVEKYIYNQKYDQQLKTLDKKQIYIKRIIGLTLFIAPIITGFISTIVLLGDYSNR